MQTVLAGVVVGSAVIGWVYALLLPKAGGRSPGWTPVPRLAAVLVALFFLLALPTGKPFASGLTLGWGFLLGGALAVLVLVTNVAEVGALAAAALGPGILLLVFHGYPNEALMGCAMGAVMVAAFARAAQGRETRGVEVSALATASVCVAARLGVEHFQRLTTTSGMAAYWAVPALLAGVGAVALAVLNGLGGNGTRPVWRGAGAAVVVVLAAVLIQSKWLSDLSWMAPLAGAVAMAFLALVFHLEGEDGVRPVLPAFAGALVVLIVGPLAFRALGGYGMALALVAGCVAAAPYIVDRNGLPSGLLGGALALFLLTVLGRLQYELGGLGRALDFQMHYNLLAVAAAAGAAFASVAFAQASAGLSVARRMTRAMGLGVVVALVPALLGLLWEERALNAMVGGLAVGQVVWMLLASWSVAEDRVGALLGAPGLYLVAAALLTVQLSRFVLDLHLTNGVKMALVAVVGLVALLRLMVDAMGRRRPAEGTADESAA